MIMKDVKFTHKGWFFMCPIYLCHYDGESIAVEARSPILEFWFDINNFIFAICVNIRSAIDPEYEPAFPFLITGEIK